MAYQILWFVMVQVFATRVKGFPSGAPQSPAVCEKMTPGHRVDPQTATFPYKLSLDVTQVKAGQEVKLTISGVDVAFKGFLVQGRQIGTIAPVGKFVAVENSQLRNCGDILGSSITHTNNQDKNSITLTWIAPGQSGTYQLLASVVQSMPVFWVAQPSESITVA